MHACVHVCVHVPLRVLLYVCDAVWGYRSFILISRMLTEIDLGTKQGLQLRLRLPLQLELPLQLQLWLPMLFGDSVLE